MQFVRCERGFTRSGFGALVCCEHVNGRSTWRYPRPTSRLPNDVASPSASLVYRCVQLIAGIDRLRRPRPAAPSRARCPPTSRRKNTSNHRKHNTGNLVILDATHDRQATVGETGPSRVFSSNTSIGCSPFKVTLMTSVLASACRHVRRL